MPGVAMVLTRLCLCFAWAFMLAGPALAAGHSAPRIGLLAWGSCDVPLYEQGHGELGSFFLGLAEFGYKPGGTVMIECRSAGQRHGNLGVAAAELAKLAVDVIVTGSQPGGRAAHEATATIPIVSILSGDPVADGLAQSLAKPGGNLTGVSYYATELTAKRLELLKELLPGIATVAVLANPDVSYLPFEAETIGAAARLGLALRIHHVTAAGGLGGAFDEMTAEKAQAVFVLPDVMFAWEAPRIAALALDHRLPSMTWGPWFTQSGCLMAYSADYDKMNRRLAFHVDRILKGARPGDLPIEQPTGFRLTINLKTAVALGLEVPQSLLLLADEVIE